MVSFQDVVTDASAKYVQGIKTATDMEAYLADAKEATGSDFFYMAVVNALESKWNETKSGS